MARSGISDAELARRIPVSRPTLLRWKEGVTARPRYREDVLRCAELLRLTADELDELLLAAGFSPESQNAYLPAVTDSLATSTVGTEAPPDAPEPAAEDPTAAEAPTTVGRRRRRIPLLAGAAAFLAIAALFAVAVGAGLLGGDEHPVAVEGEWLIVVAPFVNYTGGVQGFNVAGRLSVAVEAAVRDAGLDSVRIAEWPDELDGEESARMAAAKSNAAVVIWGEYDSGRVIARFTVPQGRRASVSQQVVDISSSPAELPTAINLELTGEVRFVALALLGRLYLEQGEADSAKLVLYRALEPPPSDADALASLRLLLAQAYMDGDLADFDEAIWLFTQVLAIQPRSVEALNGRAIAYLERGRSGDTSLAIADLTLAMVIEPDRAATSLNLAVAYLERGAEGDVNLAVSTLTRTIAAEQGYAAAYVNRAAAYMARGEHDDIGSAFDDLQTAMDVEPDVAGTHLMVANAYVARGGPSDNRMAIIELNRALELEPDSAEAYYNRGLVLSASGDRLSSLADLRRAQELRPSEPDYNAALCLQMALAGSPDAALPYCDTAVITGQRGAHNGSRAVANALLGRRTEALADLEAFLSWVSASPRDECRSLYVASRMAWVQELSAGGNPFDEATLQALRPRPSLPGRDPC